jgi:hypothetical protein
MHKTNFDTVINYSLIAEDEDRSIATHLQCLKMRSAFLGQNTVPVCFLNRLTISPLATVLPRFSPRGKQPIDHKPDDIKFQSVKGNKFDWIVTSKQSQFSPKTTLF